MKVLIDACVWRGAREAIEIAGHDVRAVGDTPPDPGDAAILRAAFDEGRVLVTLDKDFGELAILKGAPHAGIIRLAGIRAREQGPATAQILASYEPDLLAAAILTVEPTRVRIRSRGP